MQTKKQAKKVELSDLNSTKKMTEEEENEFLIKKQREHRQEKQFHNDSNHIHNHHPNMTPVVIERYEKKFRRVKEWTEGNRFLFQQKDKALHIMIKTQEQVQVPKGDKLWFFVYQNGKPKEVYPQAVIGTLHRRYKDGDGNLYIYYTDVNIFPSQERQMMVLQILVFFIVCIYIYAYFFQSQDSQEYYQDKQHQHSDT